MIIELWLLLPVVAQIEPAWVCLLNQRNFPAAAPTLQFFLTYNRVVHVAKMLEPNEPRQMIAFGKAVHVSVPVLVQTTRDVIRDPNVRRRAVFVGEDVHPVVVITHLVELIRDVSLRST